VGVVAAAVWLRRTRPEPLALPERVEPLRAPPSRRFEREPIDIVTVVDDLLDVGRL
jgi:hypothetical protein